MSALDEPELQRVLVLHTFQIPKSCLINLQTPQQMRVNYSSRPATAGTTRYIVWRPPLHDGYL